LHVEKTMSIDDSRPLRGSAQPGRLPLARSGEAIVFWMLRLTCAFEFLGHGMVGLATNPAWRAYFAVVGIPAATADRLMPLVGLADLTVGLLLLLAPRRPVVLYAAAWGTWTALLRPLAGQGGWELLEEIRNGLLPVSLLLLGGLGSDLPTFVARRIVPRLDRTNADRLAWLLRLTVATLLVGHGGMSALTGQVAWPAYLAALGLPATMAGFALAPLIGWFEIALGLVVLVRPSPRLLLFVFAWKVGTELLRPVAGEAIGQFLERAASYGAPLALAALIAWWDYRRVLPSGNAPDASVPAGGTAATSMPC
jgi:hypothetical protein